MEKSISKHSHSISVVVPTTGEGELPLLRQALMQQSLPAAEIIVIQDSDRRGAAWARNQGIAQASGEFIAFIDDDCMPPSSWLENLLNTIQQYHADIVGGTYDESDDFLRAKRSRASYPDRSGHDEHGLVGAGGNIMFRSATLRSIQALDGFVFNEHFRISQDWELIWRARSLGYTVAFTHIRVTHLKHITPSSYIRMQFNRGRGIYKLNKISKSMPTAVTLHNSLLWGNAKHSKLSQWRKLLWHKMLGPFDIQSFDQHKHFILFWIGEKTQGIGFLWASIFGEEVDYREAQP